jgi:hypothetical protein
MEGMDHNDLDDLAHAFSRAKQSIFGKRKNADTAQR